MKGRELEGRTPLHFVQNKSKEGEEMEGLQFLVY